MASSDGPCSCGSAGPCPSGSSSAMMRVCFSGFGLLSRSMMVRILLLLPLRNVKACSTKGFCAASFVYFGEGPCSSCNWWQLLAVSVLAARRRRAR
eukprot:2602050-Alexandrium_andersonii.AAC.1